jgi:lipid-A-disaccharide synthase
VHDVSAIAAARGALTKSGTVTLELAVMGVPQVVAHCVHPMTWALGRALVRGVRHIALPNVLAGREVVPEHVQWLDPNRLAAELQALPETQPIPLDALGPPGAAARAAEALREHLDA